MSGFWLIGFIVLWIVVVGLALVILAMAKEIENLHVRLDSVVQYLGSPEYSTSKKSNQLVLSLTEEKQ